MEEVPNSLALLRGWVPVGMRGKGEDVEVVASGRRGAVWRRC